MKERPALRKQLDALYGGPREDFVSERNALAKRLKAEGRGEEAERVRGLSKPSVAAAVLNAVALESPGEMKAFAQSAAGLRKASGQRKGKGDRLRSVARAEREAAAAVLARAEKTLGKGGPANATTTLDRIGETLQAAAADPDVEALVVVGRLDKERRAAGFGFAPEGSDEEPEAKPITATERRKGERARAREEKKVDRARRDLEAAERARGKAKVQVSELEERLERARGDGTEAAEAVERAEQELRERERALRGLD